MKKDICSGRKKKMIRIILIGIFVGLPLLAMLVSIVYTCYICVKYTKDHKR